MRLRMPVSRCCCEDTGEPAGPCVHCTVSTQQFWIDVTFSGIVAVQAAGFSPDITVPDGDYRFFSSEPQISPNRCVTAQLLINQFITRTSPSENYVRQVTFNFRLVTGAFSNGAAQFPDFVPEVVLLDTWIPQTRQKNAHFAGAVDTGPANCQTFSETSLTADIRLDTLQPNSFPYMNFTSATVDFSTSAT